MQKITKQPHYCRQSYRSISSIYKNPNPIAKNIKRIDAVPERAPVKSSGVCGLYAKVEAQISVKAATTRTNVTQAKTLNSFFPFHLY